jgi:hypothetical protein
MMIAILEGQENGGRMCSDMHYTLDAAEPNHHSSFAELYYCESVARVSARINVPFPISSGDEYSSGR